jgi:hypothetical protein
MQNGRAGKLFPFQDKGHGTATDRIAMTFLFYLRARTEVASSRLSLANRSPLAVAVVCPGPCAQEQMTHFPSASPAFCLVFV